MPEAINRPLCGCALLVKPKGSSFATMRVLKLQSRKGEPMANKSYSLAHTKWMCKYHIVFTPKYRRKIIYNKYREDLKEISSVSSFMGYLKGKSALMMFEKHANLKYKFGNRHFWAEGYM